MDKLKLKQKFEAVIDELNADWKTDPDMKDTPERLANMYAHFFRNEDVDQHLIKRFPSRNSQMVVVKNIECFGMCPHHFAPIIYKVHIGYIPSGWVLGLSKLARIAIALSSYPKLQENFTTEIADVIEKNLKPRGVMVIVDGIHGCMRCRGVEQNASTITSDLRGEYKKDRITTQEFIEYIKMDSHS